MSQRQGIVGCSTGDGCFCDPRSTEREMKYLSVGVHSRFICMGTLSQVPEECKSPACLAISFAAHVLSEFKDQVWTTGMPVELKVGLHSGPVTAGIAGTQALAAGG